MRHGRDCQYSEREHKERFESSTLASYLQADSPHSRPSKLRISQLEEENARLRESAMCANSPQPDKSYRARPGMVDSNLCSDRDRTYTSVHENRGSVLMQSSLADCQNRLFRETARQSQFDCGAGTSIRLIQHRTTRDCQSKLQKAASLRCWT